MRMTSMNLIYKTSRGEDQITVDIDYKLKR